MQAKAESFCAVKFKVQQSLDGCQVRTVGEQGPSKPCAMEHEAAGPGEKWNRRKIGACSPFHKCQVTQAPQSPLYGKSVPQVSREKLRPPLCAVRSKVQQRLCG